MKNDKMKKESILYKVLIAKDIKRKIRGRYTVSFVPKEILEIFKNRGAVDNTKVIGIRKGKHCIALVYYHACGEYVMQAACPLPISAVETSLYVLYNAARLITDIENAEKKNGIIGIVRRKENEKTNT